MRIWSMLSHPNILEFIGTCQFNANIYMVSPWAENGDVGTYLRQHGDIDRLRVVTYSIFFFVIW